MNLLVWQKHETDLLLPAINESTITWGEPLDARGGEERKISSQNSATLPLWWSEKKKLQISLFISGVLWVISVLTHTGSSTSLYRWEMRLDQFFKFAFLGWKVSSTRFGPVAQVFFISSCQLCEFISGNFNSAEELRENTWSCMRTAIALDSTFWRLSTYRPHWLLDLNVYWKWEPNQCLEEAEIYAIKWF